MKNKQQSSLDFYRLESQKLIETNMRGGITIEEYFSLEEILYNKAKAMHKEEMIDFAMKFMMQDRPIISFYNSTFGGNNE